MKDLIIAGIVFTLKVLAAQVVLQVVGRLLVKMTESLFLTILVAIAGITGGLIWWFT